MKNNIGLIISREYSLRVKKKGFIVTTLLMPVFILLMMFAPTLLAGVGSELPSSVTVVDESGYLAAPMAQNASLPYRFADGQPVDSILADPENKIVLVLGKNVVKDPTSVTLYSHDSSSLELEMIIKDDVKNAIEAVRLSEYNIDNLKEILDEIEADVVISTKTIDDDGQASSSDTLTSFLVGIAMAFLLYMFIVIYGQLVMQSIIEEKNNRVLELIVTSVKPTHLMLGKILGIGAVAVTQVLIWGLLITGFITFALPEITGPQLMADVEAMRSGTLDISTTSADISLLQTLAMLSSLGFIFQIFGYMLLFLIGGFLLYASLYAAIGASVDNAQDGAQLQVFALIPVIVGLMFAMSVGQNPNSELATWLSIIPFTSPMVMMARIPAEVPMSEIVASLVLLYATIILTVWFTAKIYRVGIFMYGKKPTIKELVRWARYK